MDGPSDANMPTVPVWWGKWSAALVVVLPGLAATAATYALWWHAIDESVAHYWPGWALTLGLVLLGALLVKTSSVVVRAVGLGIASGAFLGFLAIVATGITALSQARIT